MNKRIIIFVTVLTALCGHMKASVGNDPAIIDLGGSTELGVSYGGLPAMRWLEGYSGHWQGINPWGVVAISIDHRFAPRIWAGMSYTISSASSGNASDGREGSVVWHSLMVHGRYTYGWSGRWSFYGGGGLGVIISYMQPSWAPTYNRTHFAFQATPVAAQFRILDNFDVFAEAGFGVQGILRGGLRVDF